MDCRPQSNRQLHAEPAASVDDVDRPGNVGRKSVTGADVWHSAHTVAHSAPSFRSEDLLIRG